MFKYKIEEIPISQIKSTQKINVYKKNEIKKSIHLDGYSEDILILVSKDNEVIDGNHRFVALSEINKELRNRYNTIRVRKSKFSKEFHVSTARLILFILLIFILDIIFK